MLGILAFVIAALALPSIAVAQAEQPVDTAISLTAKQHELLRLAPGVPNAQWTFPLDTCNSFVVQIDSGIAVSVTLTAPDGTLLKPDTIADWGTYEYFAGQGGSSDLVSLALPSAGANRYLYRLKAKQIGNYTVHVSGSALMAHPILAQVSSDSTLKVGAFENTPGAIVGSRAIVTVAVYDKQTPIKNAMVSALITSLSNMSFSNSIGLDDGLFADIAAKDGLYTLEFSPQTFGAYFIRFTVTGQTLAGEPFTRTTSARVDIETPHAWFVRPPTILGNLAYAANGKISELSFTFGVGCDGPRIVRGSFDIALPSGRIAVVETPMTNVPSNASVRATLSALQLANLAEDGVLRIVKARLYDRDSNLGSPIDTLSPLNNALPPFAATNLDLPPIQFLDTPASDHVIMDAAYDDDANSKYDRLKTWLPIRVLVGGQYRYSASLYDKCDYLIQTIYGTTTLQPGANQTLELEFAGRAIGYHGIDGEYYVKGAVLHNATGSAMQPYPYLTRQWSVPLFEEFYACADRNQNGECDRCDIYRDPGLDANGNGILDSRETCALVDLTGDAGLPSGPDGNVTLADYLAFLEAYAAGSPIADITGIGGVPDGQVNMLDFNAFMNMWQACALGTIGGGGNPGGQP